MDNYLAYAGIGSRDTPLLVLKLMRQCATKLHSMGYILRSGGAKGADTAFELGVPDDRKEIFLPWPNFNCHDSEYTEPSLEAFVVASQHHPAWERCGGSARALHARNVHQVLGDNLVKPVKFILCYTMDGKDSGGTGQAIRIARARNIPVINMHDPEWRKDIRRVLSTV